MRWNWAAFFSVHAQPKEMTTEVEEDPLVLPKDKRLERYKAPVRLLSSRSLQNAKSRIVILGTGWGSFSLVDRLDKEKFDVQVISPANHFLFTPLLPSTVTGTVEFRVIQEPIRTVRGIGYFQAKAAALDGENRQVKCFDVFKNEEFRVEYDFLVIATGAKTSTFNTPGIAENEGKSVFYLKHLYHARLLRNRILECFERAAIHLTEPNERDELLSFVVVGGGPTSCELIGELNDFLRSDVAAYYLELKEFISIHLVESNDRLLQSFDPSVANIVQKRFEKRGIKLHIGKRVVRFDSASRSVHLNDGEVISAGTVIWNAGLQQTNFVDSLDLRKGRGGRIQIDENLRIQNSENRIFAIGDCAVNEEEPLAALAQAASQQGKHLAACFNASPNGVGLFRGVDRLALKPFKYFSMGSMVTFGGFKGAVDFSQVGRPAQGTKNFGILYGALSYLMWRSVYWTRQNSVQNRILILVYWAKAFFGHRDISRF